MRRNWRQRAALVLCLAIATGSRVARAEMTVETLTGNAITGVGPYYQDVKDAIGLFAKGDFSGALAHLESAKKATPRLAPAEVMMAQLYLDANLLLPAFAMLEKAMVQAPQDPEPAVLLGERAVAEGRATEADFMFQKAAKLLDSFSENPRRKQDLQLRTFSGWASADESRGNWKGAQARLEQLIKFDARNANPHDRLGRVLYRLAATKEQKEAAYKEFQLAADLDKTLMPADLAMATLASDRVQAERWLKHALENNGQDLRTQLGAANYLLRANQPEEARKRAEAAIKLDPDSVDANIALGMAARLLADYKTAEAHLSKAHLLAPTNFAVINHLSLVCLDLPGETNRQRALQFAELGARQNPNNVEALSTLGWVSYRLNRRQEAEKAFSAVMNSSAVISSHMMTSEMGYYMANLAKDSGKIPQAVKLLKEALNNDQPFAYRKPAQQLLAQLSAKLEKPPAGKDKAADAPQSDDAKTSSAAAK